MAPRGRDSLGSEKEEQQMSIHAWFSAETALRHGSAVYRKPGGATVNVTRMSSELDAKGPFPHDERYVGQVIRVEDGGCVVPTARVDGITSQFMRASEAMRTAGSSRTPKEVSTGGSRDA
jgi:hypothetical protein